MIEQDASRRQVRPGRQPTAVFLNGLGMPLELWAPVIAALPPDLAIVTFDRPAHSPYAADDLDAQLDEIDDVLGDIAGPLLLVGHSYGGVLAEGYARQRPLRVCGLVLVDPALPADYAASAPAPDDAPTGLPWWRNAAIRLSDVDGLQPLLSWLTSTSMVATATRQGDFTATVEGLPAGAIERIIGVGNVTRAMLDDHFLPTICRAVLDDRAATGPLQLPTAILVGTAGPRVWPADQPGWAARQRDQSRDVSTRATVTELAGAHLLMLDCPADIADAIGQIASSEGDCR